MTNLLDLLRVLRKHWLKAAIAFVVTLATVAVGILTAPPVFEATAVLLVRVGREYLYQPGPGDRRAVVSRDSQSVINNEIQILRSGDLIRKAITELGEANLYPDLASDPNPSTPPLAVAERMFAEAYSAQALPDTSVIRLSFRHPDPEMVARALNSLVDAYREKHLEAFGNPGTTAFLQEQVASLRERLEESDKRINEVLQQEPSLASDRGESGLFSQQERLETSAKEAQSRIDGLAEELRFLTSQLEATGDRETAGSRAHYNRAIEDAKMRLLNLQLEEQRLLGRFSESNRQVVNVREQIELAETFLEKQEALIGTEGAYEDLERRILEKEGGLRFEQARLGSLRDQLSTLSEVLTALPVQKARYRDLVRERDVHEENYRTYLNKLEEARIAEEMDRQKMASISVIQEARVPIKPVGSRRALKLVVGALLGAALGLAVAVLAELSAGWRPAPQT